MNDAQANETNFARISHLLQQQEIKEIAETYRTQSKRHIDLGFNLFRLISNTYTRENLHSQIIKALLDPLESHGAGLKFLHALIDWVNEQPKGKELEDLTKSKFTDPYVRCEQGRVDILISDNKSGDAIIIENKINNAVDQEKQIPRYLEYTKKQNYKCVAIIYLTLSHHKEPYQGDWEPSERNSVNKLLVPVVASDHSERCMIQGWLRKCEYLSENCDTIYTLRHYIKLLMHLKEQTMDYETLNQFFENLKNDKWSAFDTATSIAEMLEKFPYYQIEKIKKELEADPAPFNRVESIQSPTHRRAQLRFEDGGVTLDVVVTEANYELRLWEEHYDRYGANRIDEIVKQSSDLSQISGIRKTGPGDFGNDEDFYSINFSFPKEEGKLLDEIKKWRQAVKHYYESPREDK